MLGRVEVQRAGDCHGYNWTVIWKTVGGDKSELKLDKSDLMGPNVTVSVYTHQEGGIIFGPLTGEFLYLPERSPQVRYISIIFYPTI